MERITKEKFLEIVKDCIEETKGDTTDFWRGYHYAYKEVLKLYKLSHDA